MVFIRRRRATRRRVIRRRRLAPRRSGMFPRFRRMIGNIRPVFTETVNLGSVGFTYTPSGGPTNTFGGLLSCNMGLLPQLSQYETLYQKYRILRAQWTLVPNWTQYDQNSSNGITNALDASYWSATRIVYAISDSPGQVPPSTELQVLNENGCKIRMMNKIFKVSCRPVPDTEDTNGVSMSFRGKYINFVTATPGNIEHLGVRYFLTAPSVNVGSQAGIVDPPRWTVFLKLTFQLADPR